MSFTEFSTAGFSWDAAPVLPLPVAAPAAPVNPATREATDRAIDPNLPGAKKPTRQNRERQDRETVWSDAAAQAQVDAVLARISRLCPIDYDLSDDLDCWNALEAAVQNARAKKRRAALSLALDQYERLAINMFERHVERQELMAEQLDFDMLPTPKYN